jgi:hypothetical protein
VILIILSLVAAFIARFSFSPSSLLTFLYGLHSFGEIDLPVGYLISVSPTVSQHVKYNKIKELAERVGFESTTKRT